MDEGVGEVGPWSRFVVVMQMGEWTSSGYKDGCLLSCGPMCCKTEESCGISRGYIKEWNGKVSRGVDYQRVEGF